LKKRIIRSYTKLRQTNVLANFFNLSGIQLSNIVLLLLIIRIVTGIAGGYEVFGLVMTANRFAQFIGTVVNYGTGLSGVRDVAYNINDKAKLSVVFYNILWIRAAIFMILILILAITYWLTQASYIYLLTIPIILAEVFNPLCFFIGTEKIKIFNAYNFLSNIVAIVVILLFIKTPESAFWVNFILGTLNTITYLGLFIFLSRSLKLSFQLPPKNAFFKIVKDNFYLTVNAVSGNLQQSFIVFALVLHQSALLGAYTLADRVIAQYRNLLNIIANAIYPNAVNIYKQNINAWNVYRRKTKYVFSIACLAGAMIIMVFADFIVCPILSPVYDANSALLLRIMAFVPVISALNVPNMLDQLIKNNTVYMFKVSVVLFFIAGAFALIAIHFGSHLLIGAFTLVVETSAWLMFEYAVNKPVKQHA
jgi:O-antigen/teichoic acid export membrane protein